LKRILIFTIFLFLAESIFGVYIHHCRLGHEKTFLGVNTCKSHSQLEEKECPSSLASKKPCCKSKSSSKKEKKSEECSIERQTVEVDQSQIIKSKAPITEEVYLDYGFFLLAKTDNWFEQPEKIIEIDSGPKGLLDRYRFIFICKLSI
jgi:hypothetical protein